jgi:ribosomal protein S19
VKTEAQAQEDKKSDKIKTAIANNIILPTVDTLTSTVTLGSKNAT